MAANSNLKIGIFLLAMLLTSCFSRSSLMTYETFDTVQIGTPIAVLQPEIGKPYAIHSKDGMQEYEYVERIDTGGDLLIAENHYFLIVQDGKVVGKYMTREKPPAYNLIYQDEPNYPGYNP